MADPSSIHITAEPTPNPHTMRFVINKTFLEFGTVDFPDKSQPTKSQLVDRLFKHAQVVGVMIGRNFITVTKDPKVEWEPLVPQAVEMIRAGLLANETVVPAKPEQAHSEEAINENDSPVVKKIKAILDAEIRPAVAMDGGDITFLGFAEGVVTLALKGSCSSCPSSVMTLKMGVENRLKSEIPEIKEVVNM